MLLSAVALVLQVHLLRHYSEALHRSEHITEISYYYQVFYEDAGERVRDRDLHVPRGLHSRQHTRLGHCLRPAHPAILPCIQDYR